MLPVARGHDSTPGLKSFSWSPQGRWLAAVLAPAAADADISLVLLDGNRAGSLLWSYSLRGTSGSASPGAHNVSWSPDGSAMMVIITAGFACKFQLRCFGTKQGCCERRCRSAEIDTCPGYFHVDHDAKAQEAIMAGLDFVNSLGPAELDSMQRLFGV